MIRNFRDAETAIVWDGRRSRKLPPDIQTTALRKLMMLHRSRTLNDLRAPASGAYGSTGNGAFALAGTKETHVMSKSSTTTMSKARKTGALLPLVTPGKILMEEFLGPMGLSQNALARAIRVPPRRINEIVLGQRAVTADTDLRLARYFGMSEGFFLGLQTDHDLRAKKREISKELSAIAIRQAAE